jgi:MFS family permease
MLLFAIFFVSFSTLAFEVLLTRVFAIGQWNHLSFMVISIALFGFGASGTFLSLFEVFNGRRQWHSESRMSLSILLFLFSVCTILSFLALNQIPLDYFRLPVEPLQSIYLLAAYLCLSLPFFVSGLIIAIGYTTAPEKAGLIYFSSMSGSAIGAIVPVLLLPLLGEGKLILISAAVPLIPAMVSTLKLFHEPANPTPDHPILRNAIVVCSLATIGFVAYLLTTAGLPIIRVTPSPYKALGQILQFPKTQIMDRKFSIKGRIDRVKTPYVRFAPGLSLKYTQTLPDQHVIYTDGDNSLVLYDLNKKDDSSFATYMLSFAGYSLIRHPEDVLLIQQGGGSAVPCALASGAVRISIVEQNRSVADILRRKYPRLHVINEDPRVFLAQSTDRYDIIHIENWGASIPGAAALNQEHTFTIEAFREYWNHLKSGGVISISRKLLLPPSDSLRLWSTAFEVLHQMGIPKPRDYLALIRNFDTFTLLISKSPVNAHGVIEFARDRNFDLVFLKSMDRNMANRYHVFQEPFHHLEINRLAQAWKSGRPNEFFNGYLLDVRPQSDRRPFPSRFLKWSKVKELYASVGSGFYALFMSGEIVVSLVFVEALILAVCLLIIPVILSTRKIKKPTFAQVSYFFGIGAGFMFVELYFIKFFILIFGDPTISFTIVVSAILIFSSLGGLYMHTGSIRRIRPALFTLIGGLILVTAGLELMADYLLTVSNGWRYLVALLLMLPVGFLMGMPFPLGMHYLLENQVQRAYAWSVNGCASVLSVIAAAQFAMSFGIPAIMAGAFLAYILAFVAIKKGGGKN